MSESDKPTISTLASEHIQDAAPLLLTAWQEFAHNTDLSDDERFRNTSAEDWLSRFLAEGGQGFVAVLHGQVAGVITCSILDSPGYYKSPRHLFINDVAIHPGFRRRGIGLLLEQQCETFARDSGIDLVLGEIYAYNEASRAMMHKLERKLGYEVWYKYL